MVYENVISLPDELEKSLHSNSEEAAFEWVSETESMGQLIRLNGTQM